MTEKRTSPNSGKKPHQKYKSFVVLQYLLKNSDEDHVVSAKAIVEDLQEEYGLIRSGVPYDAHRHETRRSIGITLGGH